MQEFIHPYSSAQPADAEYSAWGAGRTQFAHLELHDRSAIFVQKQVYGAPAFGHSTDTLYATAMQHHLSVARATQTVQYSARVRAVFFSPTAINDRLMLSAHDSPVTYPRPWRKCGLCM